MQTLFEHLHTRAGPAVAPSADSSTRQAAQKAAAAAAGRTGPLGPEFSAAAAAAAAPAGAQELPSPQAAAVPDSAASHSGGGPVRAGPLQQLLWQRM